MLMGWAHFFASAYIRIKEADEVRDGHAPELDGLSNHFRCHWVAPVVSGKNVPRSQAVATL